MHWGTSVASEAVNFERKRERGGGNLLLAPVYVCNSINNFSNQTYGHLVVSYTRYMRILPKIRHNAREGAESGGTIYLDTLVTIR